MEKVYDFMPTLKRQDPELYEGLRRWWRLIVRRCKTLSKTTKNPYSEVFSDFLVYLCEKLRRSRLELYRYNGRQYVKLQEDGPAIYITTLDAKHRFWTLKSNLKRVKQCAVSTVVYYSINQFCWNTSRKYFTKKNLYIPSKDVQVNHSAYYVRRGTIRIYKTYIGGFSLTSLEPWHVGNTQGFENTVIQNDQIRQIIAHLHGPAKELVEGALNNTFDELWSPLPFYKKKQLVREIQIACRRVL
jgi:hypothetical protein